MDERQSVLGFTEAELGFFLAALCLVLWLVSTAAAPPAPEEAMVPADSASLLADELAETLIERDSLAEAYQALRDSVSGILPSCSRIGRAEGPRWTITVLGRDRVLFDHDVMRFREFGARTWREREKVLDTCLHQVVVRFPRRTSGAVTEHARGELWRLRLRIARVDWVGSREDQ